MKDSISLIFSAICMAAIAWLFWHFAGNSGINIILIIAVIVLIVDNIRLRKQLHVRESKGQP